MLRKATYDKSDSDDDMGLEHGLDEEYATTKVAGEHGKDDFCPKEKISAEKIKQLYKPRKYALVMKVLGSMIGLKFSKARLAKMLNPVGDLEAINLNNDYFIVRHSNHGDTITALTKDPWIIAIYDSPTMETKVFCIRQSKQERVTIWISILGLPIEYYNRHTLWRRSSSENRF